MKSLFELVKHYQLTEEYLPEVFEHQLNYIIDNAQEFFDEYVDEYQECGETFQEYLVRRLKDWEILNGLGKEITSEMIEELQEDAEDSVLAELLKVGKDEDTSNECH